jgi:phosphoglycolate phosphatase
VIKLLIFDLDGTLIDSAPDIVASIDLLMHERGLAPLPRHEVIAAIGGGLRQLVLNLFPEILRDPPALTRLEADVYRVYETHLLDRTKVYPGVESFLSSWKGQLAIVTNKHEKLAKDVVAGLGLDRFPWLRVFGGDTFPLRKPDPFPLDEIVRIAGVDRSETVMIGDGLPDMIAARRAGIHSIACRYGYTPHERLKAEAPSLWIDQFADLPAAIGTADKLGARERGG